MVLISSSDMMSGSYSTVTMLLENTASTRETPSLDPRAFSMRAEHAAHDMPLTLRALRSVAIRTIRV